MRTLLPAINLVLIMTLTLAIVWAVYEVLRLTLRRNRDEQKGKSRALPDDAGVRDLLAQGRSDEAVRLYQQFTGVDVFTAQEAVSEIQQNMVDERMERLLRDHLKAGDKAAAIEAYQEATGATLHEALDFVEQLQKR